LQKIRQIKKCGSKIYAVGNVWSITQNGTKFRRPGLFSFSATAPYKLSALRANVNGEVDSIAFTSRQGCAHAYIGGSFTSVNGKSAHNIAEISTRTGKVVSTFGRHANGQVDTIVGYKRHLLVGGKFTRTNGSRRPYFESLNAVSGKVDRFVNLHIRGRIRHDARQVYNQEISHNGRLDLVEGNFTSVGSKARQQIFMLSLAGSTAKVTRWTSPPGAESGLGQKYPSRLRSSMAASLVRSSARVWPRSVILVTAISAMTSATVDAVDSTAPVQVMSPTVR
jgi:hypothetical protein